MELFDALGLNVKILLAQLVNFAVLLFVIYKFAYGPIMKVLSDRQEKIESGIKNADEAQKKLQEAVAKESEVLKIAREEAQKIINKAEEIGKKNKEEIIIEAKKQTEIILANAEKKIEEEKNKMFAEVKGKIADLVVMATEKLIDEKIDANKDKGLIEKSLQ